MRGLLLFDWDNTIVDESVQINDSRFHAAVKAKIEQGWLVGLNSDTPLRRLQAWSRSLSLNGPIVAEKGAVCWWPDGQVSINSPTEAFFSNLRKRFIESVTQFDGYTLLFGDSTEFIRSVKEITSSDEILVALDAYRRCSIGLFVRRIAKGNLVCDSAHIHKVYDLFSSLVIDKALLSQIDFNLEHCYLGLGACDINKTVGVQVLLRNLANVTQVVMIGDSQADYIGIADVRHFAVANAQESFKVKAEYVASSSFAQGCVEILDYLERVG